MIDAPAGKRLLVEAGPGTGKTLVACARIAQLVRSGTHAPRVLLISFTRSAVAELGDRISGFLDDVHSASSVKISTIDSHAWHLRVGFEQEEVQRLGGDVSFDSNLERTAQLLVDGDGELMDFLATIEHLIVDEAQDVVGVHAQFLAALIDRLPKACGITVLADPAQAIYGFTMDNDEPARAAGSPQVSLLTLLHARNDFQQNVLPDIFRTSNPDILTLFGAARAEVVRPGLTPPERLEAVRRAIEGNSSQAPDPMAIDDLKGADHALVLYRRRVEVLQASSFLSDAAIEHRLRMSRTPTVVAPWLGRLFGECTDRFLPEVEFRSLWERRHVDHLFRALARDDAWALLQRLAGDRDRGRLDLVYLRRVLSRARPPAEVCEPECGVSGPILGTIHASKGREADLVRLMLPHPPNGGDQAMDLDEESRVLYVAATRARAALELGSGFRPGAGYLSGSNRIYRRVRGTRAQVQVGLDGDVDPQAHVEWPNARQVQELLVELADRTCRVFARSSPKYDWNYRVFINRGNEEVAIAHTTDQLKADLWKIANAYGRNLKPSGKINNLFLIGVTTAVSAEDGARSIRPPYSESGIFLAPIIKGFSVVVFSRYTPRRGQG